MTSSSSVFQVEYSTIRNKSLQSNHPNHAEESQKITKKIQNALGKQTQSPLLSRSQNPVDLREKLIISDLKNFNFKLAKKGKKGGGLVVRDICLTDDQQGLVQKVNNKSYDVPTEFWPETKTEYNEKVSNKDLKNKTLPWTGNALSNFEYRIAFCRNLSTNSRSQDSAFYFANNQEWNKAKNFFKVFSILDSPQNKTDAKSILMNLSKNLKSQIFSNLQKLLSIRANQIREEHAKLKQSRILDSQFLNNLDKSLVHRLGQRWMERVNGIVYSNEQKRIEEERLEKIRQSVENSPLIMALNSKMSYSLLNSWKHQAELAAQIKKEDINIVFNILEITAKITQPILKIGITVGQDFPGLIKINGVSVYKRKLEYTLKCKYDQVKSYDIYRWKLFSEGAQFSETQRGLLQKHNSMITNELNDGQFCIQFDSFELEYLDSVEIKMMLFNETETLKGYHYASLRDFYTAGQHGNNIWFSMKLNHLENTKFPLINVRVKSQPSKNVPNQQLSLMNSQLVDAFFDYSFKFPQLTPKHARILDLCPISWNISDEKIGNLRNQRQYTEYIKRVIRKLSKHYYKESSKQLARLKKSTYLWADLQDNILHYQTSSKTKGSVYLTGENLQNALETNRMDFESKNPPILSYLFKRDLWEVKPEWRPFYNDLKLLFKKGIPAQQRTHLWSEIGKTVFFLDLTEKHFKDQTSDIMVEDVQTKSKRIYLELKEEALKIYTETYQELEDDIEYLKRVSNTKKLTLEGHLRNICKTFVYWSRIINDSSSNDCHYTAVYSRSILVLCQGLLTCQNCSYLDGGSINEEHHIFWLLISLTNYVLASYYVINEQNSQGGPHEINLKVINQQTKPIKSSLTDSPLLCNSVSGIRSDLLLLRILLSANEKELFNKFHEFGTPLEFYFADHILTLFYNLFNPGLAFRIWDIIFFEGTSFNKVKTNRLIVSILYAFIKQCKEQLLEAKKSSDFKMVFELNGKFLTKYGDFIKEIYNVYDTFFATDSVSWSEGGIKSIFKIQCLNVTDSLKVGDAEKQLGEFEKTLAKHYIPIQEQNKTLHKIMKTKEGLSYPRLQKMIQALHAGFGDEKTDLKKSFSRGKITSLHVKVHSIKTPYDQNAKLKLYVGYGSQSETKEDIKPLKANFEVEISLKENDYTSQFIAIQVFDCQQFPERKILSSKVDIRGFPLNTVAKLVIKLDEENSEILNHTGSEAEISILLDAIEPQTQNPKDSRFGNPFILAELQSDEKMFKKINMEKTSLPKAVGGNTIHLQEYAKYSIFSRNKHQWKEKFALTLDEFQMIMKEVDSSWTTHNSAELSQIYSAFVNANINKKFYLINFFVLLILNGKCSLSEKYDLIFSFIAGFDHTFETKTGGSLPSYVMKSLLDDIYEMFMIYIPLNELENMVDLEIKGHTCSIKKLSISGNFSIKVNYPRSILNKLSNFTQVYYNCRELHLYNPEVLKLLKEVYEKSLVAHPNHLLTQRNEIQITYHTNGISHKTVIPIDQNWNIIDDVYDIPLSQSIQSKLLYVSKDIIALQHTPYSISKNEFIRVMQKMPLINFFNSFEQIQALPEALPNLKEAQLIVKIGGNSPVFDQVFPRISEGKQTNHIEKKIEKKRKGLL